MRGLAFIPSLTQLESAYQKIQSDIENISLDEWALWSQWSRFDARLAEQLVATLAQCWKKISPLDLNEKILQQPWPAAFGVLLSHVEERLSKEKIEQERFRLWFKTVMIGVHPATFEQFYIGTMTLGSKRMNKEPLRSTILYSKWGYLGSEYLWNKKKPDRTISLKNSRSNAIENLIQNKKPFTVRNYIEELNGNITQRQAQRDLMNHPKLQKIGNTRNRTYRRKTLHAFDRHG